jgi:hypothetical protein
MPDRVDTRMKHVQPTDVEAIADRVTIHTEAQQLLARDDPVLKLRERGDLRVSESR